MCTVYPYGTVKIENPQNGTIFEVNDQRLKPFFELKNPKVEEILLKDLSYQTDL